MDNIITQILAICGGIACIGGAVVDIAKLFGWLKKPNDKQDKLLKDHEELLKKHAELLEKDNKRLLDLEEQDRLVLQSLFALLSHGIDGNDVEAMKKCKDNIQDYLILKWSRARHYALPFFYFL